MSQLVGPSGIAKAIDLTVEGSTAVIDHTLTNSSEISLDIAPWGITQLPPGGTAILPLPLEPTDPFGLQPNAELVVWPYTGVADTGFAMVDRLILLDANRTTATKVGAPNVRGWLAYLREGLLFVKRAEHRAGGRYLDRGASAQCYCNADFLELETLGEQVLLAPGESVSHREVWELYAVDPHLAPQEIPQLLELDGGTP